MPSFQKMWRRWNATVCVLRNTRFATCRLLSPWATRSVTRRSVSVRLSQPKAGRSAWVQCAEPGARGPQAGPYPGQVVGVAELFVQGVGLAEQGRGPALIALPGPGVPGVLQRAGRARAAA